VSEGHSETRSERAEHDPSAWRAVAVQLVIVVRSAPTSSNVTLLRLHAFVSSTYSTILDTPSESIEFSVLRQQRLNAASYGRRKTIAAVRHARTMHIFSRGQKPHAQVLLYQPSQTQPHPPLSALHVLLRRLVATHCPVSPYSSSRPFPRGRPL
jgi:hypothetical protein